MVEINLQCKKKLMEVVIPVDHSALNLLALHGMNIPMFAAIKRCTPIVSLVLSVLILKKEAPSPKVVLSVLVITFGIVLAATGDLDCEWKSYITGFLSVFAQVGHICRNSGNEPHTPGLILGARERCPQKPGLTHVFK